jgi:AcrR family transcriptional regulator
MEKFNKKKELIKEAGRKMFATYGYHKTTLDDIAGLMKLKKNSLYYYFPNKESLFHELIQDEIALYQEKQD